MEWTEVLPDPATRRAFLRTSGVTFVGGSATFLVACGDDPTKPRAAPGGGGGTSDVDILNQALDLEHTAIAAYTAGAKLLTGEALTIVRKWRGQEQEHAAGLERAIKQMGGTPHVPKQSYAEVIGDPKSQADILKLASVIENALVQGYVGAIPRLTEPKLRATAAAIVTNEAEHITLLRGLLGLTPVPSAFVDGTEA